MTSLEVYSHSKNPHPVILLPSVGSASIDCTWFTNDTCDMGPADNKGH